MIEPPLNHGHQFTCYKMTVYAKQHILLRGMLNSAEFVEKFAYNGGWWLLRMNQVNIFQTDSGISLERRAHQVGKNLCAQIRCGGHEDGCTNVDARHRHPPRVACDGAHLHVGNGFHLLPEHGDSAVALAQLGGVVHLLEELRLPQCSLGGPARVRVLLQELIADDTRHLHH